MKMQEIRQKYPQYNDLSDEQLAQGLHKKFYSDMPFDQFAGKIGLKAAATPAESAAPERGLVGRGVAGLIGEENMQAADRFVNESPVLKRAAEFGSGIPQGVGRLLDVPGHLVNALIPGEGPVKGAFEAGAEALGGSYQPTDATGRVLQRAGQEVGASAIPTAAALQYAKNAPQMVRAGGGVVRRIVDDTVQAAKSAPAAFAGTDAAGSAASGVGAGVAREAAPGSPTAELVGQLAPVLAPAALAGGVRRMVQAGGDMPANLQAFDAAGASPTLGQATGQKWVQGLETVLSKLPGGGPLRQSTARAADAMAKKISGMADSVSPRGGAEVAGRTIESGVTTGFSGRFRSTADGLFSRVDSLMPPTAAVRVDATRGALDNLTAPIAGADNLSGVLANPKLNQIKKAFDADIGENGQLPYRALKELRSQVGRLLTSPEIISEAPRAQLKELYGALTDDMARAAMAQGPEAAAAFSRANKFYRAGLDRIESVLQRVVNKADPEAIFRSATQGREGASTLRAVMRSLTPEERGIVSASVLRRLGRANPSSQDDLGEAFSVETFLTNWNRLSPEAKSSLFGGPHFKGYGADLDKIAKAASVIRDASQELANPSGTGQMVANIAALSTAGGALAAGDLAIPGWIAMGAAGNAGLSRLMTNPRFVRWLAQTTTMPPGSLPSHIARLSPTALGIAEDELEELQSYLSALSQAGAATQKSEGSTPQR